MNLDEYTQLKNKVDKLREKKNRAEGALSQLMKRLKEEMGVKTVSAARSALAELETDAAEARKSYEESFATFLQEWTDRLEV